MKKSSGNKFAMILYFTVVQANFAFAQSDTYVIKRGEVELKLEDIEAKLEDIPVNIRPSLVNDGDQLEKFLRELLVVKQLSKEARDKKLDQTPKYIAMANLAKDRLLSIMRLEQIKTESERGDFKLLARERYNVNPEKFNTGKRSVVLDVLIPVEKDAGDSAFGLAIENSSPIRAALAIADGKKRSDELVKIKAAMPSVIIENNVTYLENGTDTLSLAAAQLSQGQPISPPLRSERGIHTLLLLEVLPSQKLKFESVENTLVAQLMTETGEKAKKKHVDKINSEPLEMNEKQLSLFLDRYNRPAVPYTNEMQEAGKR